MDEKKGMLVLSRKIGETIVIEGSIRITVLSIRDGKIRLGVRAPRHIKVNREEIEQRIQEELRTSK